VRIYLDANATTALSPIAKAALLSVLDQGPHNPSSAHSAGALAREIIERARMDIARALSDADPDNLVFTSCGTESNNIVIRGFSAIPGAVIYCSAVEHPSVLGPVQAAGGVVLPVRPDGILDVEAAEDAVKQVPSERPVLVCVQAVNSETGIIQPISEIAERLRNAHGQAFLLVDAAQALGRVDVIAEIADAVTASGHKVHGPAGIGILWMSDRLMEIITPLAIGGGQERGVRPGTQNVAGAAALAAAVAERMADFEGATARLAALRDSLERGVLASVPGSYAVGANSPRVPNTTSIYFPGTDAQSLMARLDAEGIMCSTGSACSSGKPEASPVLKAMGMSERDAARCLRFSVSVMNTEDEIDEAVRVIARVAAKGMTV
jgi:Cysteine sulfinate desulfinase/cysteine desulfurase and related enzymes